MSDSTERHLITISLTDAESASLDAFIAKQEVPTNRTALCTFWVRQKLSGITKPKAKKATSK